MAETSPPMLERWIFNRSGHPIGVPPETKTGARVIFQVVVRDQEQGAIGGGAGVDVDVGGRILVPEPSRCVFEFSARLAISVPDDVCDAMALYQDVTYSVAVLTGDDNRAFKVTGADIMAGWVAALALAIQDDLPPMLHWLESPS